MRTRSEDVCTVVEVEMCSSLEVVPEDSEVRAVVGVILLLAEVIISTVLEGTDENNHSVVCRYRLYDSESWEYDIGNNQSEYSLLYDYN